MELYKNYCDEKFDENGVLCDFKLKYPKNFNFGYDVVDEMARLAPKTRAVMWCDVAGNEREFTFEDISKLSSKAANVFTAQGIKRGDRVLVILKRNYEYWYVAPALHKIGAIMIPATHMLTVEDMVYRIKAVGVRHAVCTLESGAAEKLMQAKEKCPMLEVVLTPRGTVEGSVDFTAEVEKASDKFDRVETKADEAMILYFTSGTTGYPKAVMHDFTYPLAHIITAKHWQCVKEGGLHLSVAETGWGKASWGKIYGQWLCGCAVMVYDFDNFTPEGMLAVIEKYRVTTFCAPPTVYRYFIKRDMTKYDLSSLTHITTAGEALNPEVFKKIYEMTGLEIFEGFGQTESVLMVGNLEHSRPKAGSIGKPSPLYNIGIVREDGSPADVGEIGELVAFPKEDGSHHGVFMGYCGDDEQYEYVWRGGFYHTGDTVYRDEDGYIFFVGRADDLIKSSGFRVSPFEIESILMEHPAVLECAVTGIPDKNRGQAIKATVVLNEGFEASEHLKKELQTFANSRTAVYKHIRKVEFIGEMSKTISGKIKHMDLREKGIAHYKRSVNYYETDKMNVVHNSNYMRYFEEARIDFMEKTGCSCFEEEKRHIMIPTVKLEADYLQPLHYGDTFEIETRLKEFNGVKLKFEYVVKCGDKVMCKGKTTHCFVNEDFKAINLKRADEEFFGKLKAAAMMK